MDFCDAWTGPSSILGYYSMAGISYDSFTVWSNYHLTTGTCGADDLEPRVEVEDLGRFHAADLASINSLFRFSGTTVELWKHIGRVEQIMLDKAARGELGNPPIPFPASLVGRGWSFSNIIGADKGKHRESVLMCDGLAGSIMIEASDLVSPQLAGDIALTSGGTRFRELADWAALFGRSIMTSGTHLGATVAGGIGTASHGSRLGFGGLQDMVVGLHIVTGIGESVWIEGTDVPVLTDAAAAQLDPGAGTNIRIIRDNESFNDSLVHLGCMGIVNCAAIRLVADDAYDKVKWIKPVGAQWLDWVAAGEWRALAQWLGRDDDPIFYEVTLNPHDWNGAHALHTMYFPSRGAPVKGDDACEDASLADALARFANSFSIAGTVELNRARLDQLADIDDEIDAEAPIPALAPIDADMSVFDPRSAARSVYEYYWRSEGFTTAGTTISNRTWRQLHGDEITGGYPGSLYNASYAIEREQVPFAIPAICRAAKSLPRSFVFTMRFVSDPSGTLAFTRFPQSAVIEIDGLSPWICRRVRKLMPATTPDYQRKHKMLRYLEFTLPQGMRRTGAALEGEAIDYSNHFAKRGFLDRAKIQSDFGPVSDPNSRLMRWRRTRDHLLQTELGKAIFWNWGAVNFGLVEAPSRLPLPLIPGAAVPSKTGDRS